MNPSLERLERRIEQQDFKLKALLAVTRAINARAAEAELLDHFRESLNEFLGIDRLVLFAKEAGGWRCLLSQGVAGQLPVVETEAFFQQPGRVVVQAGTGAEGFDVVVPVVQEDEVLAYLLVGDQEASRGVSPVVKHLHFIQTLTNVLMVALINRRMGEALLAQEATRRELELAAEMQAQLVRTRWPQDRDVDVVAYYKPHREVGGDYYDFFAVDDDRIIVCMADVSGKGVSAAFLMSNFQAHLRAIFQYEPDDLARAVRLMNERVMELAQGEKYITLFAAVYRRSTRIMQYVNCGHNPPVLLNPDGVCRQLTEGSVGLGMFDQIPNIEVGQCALPKGGVLTCFTDGLVEQENAEGVPFGVHRMEQVLSRHRGMEVADIQQALVDQVQAFRGSEPAFDDTALLTLRFK